MPQLALQPAQFLGKLAKSADTTPLPQSTVYECQGAGDGLLYTIEPGALAGMKYIAADVLVEGLDPPVMTLQLREGEKGRACDIHFSFLNQCQARIRIPLSVTDQNAWMLAREGAWLKPIVGGSRVDLAKVDRITLTLSRVAGPVKWAQTALTLTDSEPPILSDPLLPKGTLIDELGQWKLRDWPGKTKTADELKARLQTQLNTAKDAKWPDEFSAFGGCKKLKIDKATGFFRTHHDGQRWWLVDPEGYLFWSAGLDCVRSNIDFHVGSLAKAFDKLPEGAGRGTDFLSANFKRVFGDKGPEAWAAIALSQLRSAGFNTVANWSQWEIAAAAKFPYVRPLTTKALMQTRVYRDFPDVFDPAFAKHAAEYAAQLRETATDPAFIGYFLMNEPTWGFSREVPAAGMLYTTDTCFCRKSLAHQLKRKYSDDATLAKAWGIPTTFAQLESGRFAHVLTQVAVTDLADFSTMMVERLFHTISDACRKVDPNHLNLGARYHTVPPDWAIKGMTTFDVFSINCYQNKVPALPLQKIEAMVHRPVMIGEWHFGALDVGLPASGIGRVKDQADRGRAFRVYTEDAAAIPQCIGVHYFTMYDQAAIGRNDGENYNIGLWDVCNAPYVPLVTAARESHSSIYAIRRGEVKPFTDAPQYLPKIFY